MPKLMRAIIKNCWECPYLVPIPEQEQYQASYKCRPLNQAVGAPWNPPARCPLESTLDPTRVVSTKGPIEIEAKDPNRIEMICPFCSATLAFDKPLRKVTLQCGTMLAVGRSMGCGKYFVYDPEKDLIDMTEADKEKEDEDEISE